MRRAKTPEDLFGSPGPGEWKAPTVAQLKERHARGGLIFVAHHSGWVPMKIFLLELRDHDREVKYLQVETPNKGIMDIAPATIKDSLRVRIGE